MTTDICCQLCEEVWFQSLPQAVRDKQKVMLMDTGGGSLVHMSPEWTQWAFWRSTRPKHLHSYLTKAFMPCDQEFHRRVAKGWGEWRVRNEEILKC